MLDCQSHLLLGMPWFLDRRGCPAAEALGVVLAFVCLGLTLTPQAGLEPLILLPQIPGC